MPVVETKVSKRGPESISCQGAYCRGRHIYTVLAIKSAHSLINMLYAWAAHSMTVDQETFPVVLSIRWVGLQLDGGEDFVINSGRDLAAQEVIPPFLERAKSRG